ncbi:MAG TPA: TetR family transcriptional regulator [Pseudonocardiaceae bacterium]|jgi:AcrR family transcriptional regulator|nr:TetR family transcriptional regulator [Pseudonocardiaceae bacterium]
MVAEPGLRERKKQATRQRISDVATVLFAERGFDNVTVAEVADAANVSKMTVFNYFPHKEELIFDRSDEAVELVAAALRGRPAGEPVVRSLHRLLLDLIASGHPFGGVGDNLPHFWRIVKDSPTLRNAARQAADQQEHQLVTLLREHVEPQPGDPPAELVAALLVALYRTIHRQAVRLGMAGRPADEVRPRIVALVDQGFGLLETSLRDYGAH